MTLTTAQKQTLKTYIQANFPTSTDDEIRDALNAVADPAFIVWKTAVPMSEIMLNGFDWTRVDNLSVGKARIWEWMTEASPGRAIDPSKPNVRTGIDTVWVGTAADLAVRAAVYVHCKRPASLVEKILATGTGSDAVPATMGFEGQVTTQDVVDSLNS